MRLTGLTMNNQENLIYNTVYKSCLQAKCKERLAKDQAVMAVSDFRKRGFEGVKFNKCVERYVSIAKVAGKEKAKRG